MSAAQITADQVYPPRQGKKYGAVVSQGNRYMLPAALSGQVQKGQVVQIEYHQATWGDGDVTIIDKITSAQFQADPVAGTKAYNPEAKDRAIFVQGMAQAIIRSMNFGAEMDPQDRRLLVFEALENATDAYNTFASGGRSQEAAPKKAAPAASQAPAQTYRDSGKPYSTTTQDDPRFAAPVAGPDDYGAQR